MTNKFHANCITSALINREGIEPWLASELCEQAHKYKVAHLPTSQILSAVANAIDAKNRSADIGKFKLDNTVPAQTLYNQGQPPRDLSYYKTSPDDTIEEMPQRIVSNKFKKAQTSV
jgi:hypothetical protein